MCAKSAAATYAGERDIEERIADRQIERKSGQQRCSRSHILITRDNFDLPPPPNLADAADLYTFPPSRKNVINRCGNTLDDRKLATPTHR